MLDFLEYVVIFLLFGSLAYGFIYTFFYEPIKEIANEIKVNKEFKKIERFGDDNIKFFKK